MATLVLGLGNPILTDDSVGVRVAESVHAVLAAAEAPCGVDVDALSVGGLGLMEAMLGYERVILIDVFQQRDGTPGAIRRLMLEDLRAASPTERSVSSHDTSLITAVELGRRMGLPLPGEVIIYAVEAANVTDFGEELTPAVAAAIPQVMAAVLAELPIAARF